MRLPARAKVNTSVVRGNRELGIVKAPRDLHPFPFLCQACCFRNEWRRHTVKWNRRRKKDLTVSYDETKHETTAPEQDHSITSVRSNGQKRVGTEPTEKNVS